MAMVMEEVVKVNPKLVWSPSNVAIKYKLGSCYNCRKVNHIAKVCRARKKAEKNLLTEEDVEKIRIFLFSKCLDRFLTKLSEVVQEETRLFSEETMLFDSKTKLYDAKIEVFRA